MQLDNEENTARFLSRRQLVGGVAALACASLLPQSVSASVSPPRSPILKKPARFLAFDNLHTGETTKLIYWEKGRYIKGALSEINYILRDYRTGDVARIDVKLLDKLFVLHNKLESRSAFQVISGYRSPKTNALLHQNSDGVAKKSMHTEGKAIDIRLSDSSLVHVRNAALAMNSGGVGYYPESQFVHIDTGRVRHW